MSKHIPDYDTRPDWDDDPEPVDAPDPSDLDLAEVDIPLDDSLKPLKEEEYTGARRLSRKGMQRARARDLDKAAAFERQRKADREASGTPDRDDVNRALAHAVFHIAHARPDLPDVQKLLGYTVKLLREAKFDTAEAERAIGDMVTRAPYDRVEWIYRREVRAWRAGGCKGPRPEMPGRGKGIPRRADGTVPGKYAEPGAPYSRNPKRSSGGKGRKPTR